MRLWPTSYLAWLFLPWSAYALTGFNDEQTNYDPLCAHACQRVLGTAMLSCSDVMDMGHDMMAISPMTSATCYASDEPYLTSMAWCIHIKCAEDHIRTSKIDGFWERKITGDAKTEAKWSYAEALQHVFEPPKKVLGAHETLNFTALANDTIYTVQADTLQSVYVEGKVESIFGIVLLAVGAGIPIVITLLSHLPFATTLLQKLKPYIIYPSTIGTYHVRPLPYSLGNAPTAGQALYIVGAVILNVVLTAVAYQPRIPSAWYASMKQEVLAFIMWRTGSLGFALLPLVILFAGRNNFLLWVTNWSHSTYLVLHRWIARIFAIQVILHSVVALALYADTGSLASNQTMSYWVWGIVATLTTIIMLVGSGLYVRKWSYEIFLLTHILLAVLTIVGCWYHVLIRFGLPFGYQHWLYAAIAAWVFDRIMRLLRILKVGVRRAHITDLGDSDSEGYVRIDIDGVRWGMEAGKHAYVYFPTLNPLKPWENHPFSILPTAILHSYHHSLSTKSKDEGESSDHGELGKHASSSAEETRQGTRGTAGVTFFVKKSNGMTKLLTESRNVLALLDGPYVNNSPTLAQRCDRLLLIGGGIGITGLLPWINTHPNAKLCWSLKSTADCLVNNLRAVLDGFAETEVLVDRRLDIRLLLDREVSSGWERIGVVVCGPGGLCDDVRAIIIELGRKRPVVFELEADAYSW